MVPFVSRSSFTGYRNMIPPYLRRRSFLIFCASPLPISLLEPCIGSTEKRRPNRTLRWPPLPGSNVQPCLSSHRLNSALVSHKDTTDVLRWRGLGVSLDILEISKNNLY